MASRSRLCVYLFLGALFPTFANCIRPFRVPTNLFVQGTSPHTLPEGIRELRRDVRESEEGIPDEAAETFEGLHNRFRRSLTEPTPNMTVQTIGSFDSLFMYWPSNSGNENVIFLLGKTKSKSSGQIISSKVMVSHNYGRSFTEWVGQTPTRTPGSPKPLIDQIYCSTVDPKLCILSDIKNKKMHHTEDMLNFTEKSIVFVPSYITFHPSSARFVMAYDSTTEKLYWSEDKGLSFKLLPGNTKSFHWGIEGIHSPEIVFVEVFTEDSGARPDNKTSVKMYKKGTFLKEIARSLDEFEIMKNYMFITQTNSVDKNPIMKVAKIVQDGEIHFKTAQFPVNEEKRDFFVFLVEDDFVFVVINHLRNLSNLYISDTEGVKYQLSLSRVLYHNPFTDVSSPWLRTVVPYAFVDVDKVKGMRGIYVATQLTPGPVGKRHLLSLITYNRGATWQRIPSPTKDIRGGRIYCYPPSCSIHVNLLYGAVYRVSPSDRMMTSTAAPGLVVTLGVASTNLKIYPDLFMSLDGGFKWDRVLRGKYVFTFGDHGGVVVAVPYRRYTRILRYTIDGGATWRSHIFSRTSILARDVVTQPGERLPVFVIYGLEGSRTGSWKAFHINMTTVLGPLCDESGYLSWTDKCLLGRQNLIQSRNYSVYCHNGRNFSRILSYMNCPCTREDFQCDYKFERKEAEHERCTLIKKKAVDLINPLVPENCSEGQYYMRSQGYRKIPGDTCVNGSEADYMPVSTPCPIEVLKGLDLSCRTKTNGHCMALHIGDTAYFNTSLQSGYIPNIDFGWSYGDEHNDTGHGVDFAARSHMFHEPGTFVVTLVASNSRSILVQWLKINVRESLRAERVNINFSPKNPKPNEAVTFSANLNYSYEEVGNVQYSWAYGNQVITSMHPVATLVFKKAKNYTVHMLLKNSVSTITKIFSVQVTLDLNVLNISSRALSPQSIEVKWEPPKGADNSITYKVFQSTLGYGSFQGITCASGERSNTSCIVDNLTPDTTYYFKVRAVSASREFGPFSDIGIATTTNVPPGPPEDLRAYATSTSMIHVVWNAPQVNNVQKYKIRYWSQIDVRDVKTIDNDKRTEIYITGLDQDTYYFFEVYAENAVGPGSTAGPVSALTKLSKPALPPRDIQKSTQNRTCLKLIWKAPYHSNVDNRTFPAKGYKVMVNSETLDVPSTYATICNLIPEKRYQGTVLAYSHSGDGPIAHFTVSLQGMRATVPRNFHSLVLSPTEVKLSWGPAPNENSRISGYTIYQVSTKPEKTYFVSGKKTSFTVTNLRAFTKYQFQISSRNNLGSSPRSEALEVLTSQSSPGIVQYLNAELVEPKSACIMLTWSKPDQANGPIKGYVLKIVKSAVGMYDEAPKPEIIEVPASSSSYLFKNLFGSTFYSFTVFARNDAGRGMQHIDPFTKKTEPAPKGAEHLQVRYSGQKVDGHGARDFEKAFVQAASMKAGISDRRIAAVELKDGRFVEFDLLPPLNSTGVAMHVAKAALDSGFSAKGNDISAGSLNRLYIHDGRDKSTPSVAGPIAGAQTGSESRSSSIKTPLAIAIPLVLIVLAMMFGLIFYYMKYRTLQKRFINVENCQDGDEMDAFYGGDMQGESPDVIFSDQTRKGRKIYKDSEKIPLEDHDELAMI
ncbi:VPS10 domain-containing receptor SorCS3-like [Acropora muricata]|uniref:VPS10 domain-containing receptor SorCS3-like n=1 Tax=Acropora muricata TaxID=159855 RepID=UPI0034E4B5BC